MAFGIQVLLPNGTDLVTQIVPIYYLDFITTPASGSRAYTAPQGKTLKVMVNTSYTTGVGNSSTASISGSTVTWSNVNAQRPVIVYAE